MCRGVGQDYMEMPHVEACYDELMFLFRRAAMLARMRCAEAMFVACEWSDDAIEISDPDNLIQVWFSLSLSLSGERRKDPVRKQDNCVIAVRTSSEWKLEIFAK